MKTREEFFKENWIYSAIPTLIFSVYVFLLIYENMGVFKSVLISVIIFVLIFVNSLIRDYHTEAIDNLKKEINNLKDK